MFCEIYFILFPVKFISFFSCKMQQLTDVLLEMESERSMWTTKEKAYLEAKQRFNICNDENSKLSEDLIKVPSIEFLGFSAHSTV